jgi:hypothetical protein
LNALAIDAESGFVVVGVGSKRTRRLDRRSVVTARDVARENVLVMREESIRQSYIATRA